MHIILYTQIWMYSAYSMHTILYIYVRVYTSPYTHTRHITQRVWALTRCTLCHSLVIWTSHKDHSTVARETITLHCIRQCCPHSLPVWDQNFQNLVPVYPARSTQTTQLGQQKPPPLSSLHISHSFIPIVRGTRHCIDQVMIDGGTDTLESIGMQG